MRLVLVGAGHAHLFVLEALAQNPIAGLETTLVAPGARAHYSGMIPGFLAGTYAEHELTFDIAALARNAGARLLQAPAERVDAQRRVVEAGGERLEFDMASVNVGSAPAHLEAPGVREHAALVRPLEKAIALRDRIDASSGPIVIVGAGAAGVEVALAVARRLRERGVGAKVTLVERSAQVLTGFAPRVERLARRALAAADVALVLGSGVAAVDATGIQLENGGRIDGVLTIWLAGAAPAPLLARSDLPTLDGFFAVDATLRAVNGAPVFGAGDCISLAGFAGLPKAGVFAVREGPVLAKNIRAALGKSPLEPYVPQKTWLALLNTADGRAIVRWHGLAAHSPLAWRLKNRIDRGFISRFSPRAGPAIARE